jgi:hypothetical protein
MISWFVGPWRERLIAAAALAAGLLLVTVGRGAPSQPGPVRFDVTVVPIDFDNLDCKSSAEFGGQRCAFDATGMPVDVARPLRPFVSTNGELLVMSGAFEAPDVADWLERTPRYDPRRVTLRCRGTWLGRAAHIEVRMRRSEAFRTSRGVPVVIAKQCSVRP